MSRAFANAFTESTNAKLNHPFHRFKCIIVIRTYKEKEKKIINLV